MLIGPFASFAGAIVRKQLFIVIFCYFLYVHFLINLGVGAFLLWKINHTASTDIVIACQGAIKTAGAQDQCKGFLNITRDALDGVVVLVLLIELCMSAFSLLRHGH